MRGLAAILSATARNKASHQQAKRRFRKRCGDRLQNAIDIPKHIIVLEAQNAVAVIGEPLIAQRVALVGRVLAAIDFHDETLLATHEVDGERPTGF